MPRLNRPLRAKTLREAEREEELRQMALTLDIVAEDVRAVREQVSALLPPPARRSEPSPRPAPATDPEWDVMRRVLEGKTRKVEAVIAMFSRPSEAGRRYIRAAHMR
jgi:hypothetical protein